MKSYCKALLFYDDILRDYIVDALIFLQGGQSGICV